MKKTYLSFFNNYMIMKSFRYFFLTTIIMLSGVLTAQVYSTYKVTGLVIDTRGEGVEGAIIKSNKTKLSVPTQKGGVFNITIADKDTELRLYINKSKIMTLPISSEIAKRPVVFALDESNDPLLIGRKEGDTYYPGSRDKDLATTIEDNFHGCKLSVDILILPVYNSRSHSSVVCNKYILDGKVYSRMPVVEISQVYSITISNHNREIKIITRDAHEAATNTTISDQYSRLKGDGDSLRGVVTDGWGRKIPGLMIRTPSGEIAMSDTLGNYAIKITKKDKFLRCGMDYTEGTSIRISNVNTSKPVNLEVMLRKNDLRGWLSDDLKTYYVGASDTWEYIFAVFQGLKYHKDCGKVIFNRYKIISLSTEDPSFALNVLDGVAMEELSLEDIDPYSLFSIKVVEEGAVPLYGAAAQFGAIVLTSKANGVNRPVELADFDGEKAKRKGGVEGMKEYIALQGKNIEYHEDGYIMIDGKQCGLYIINDDKFTHMRGIEVDMIDEIMIVRSGVEGSYGPRAKNGVVLISASRKDKQILDEDGNTVSEKEYKKQQKNR